MKNWLDKYSDNVPQAQKGKTIYVESKNDPRYKAYQDSLSLYEGSKNISKMIHDSPVKTRWIDNKEEVPSKYVKKIINTKKYSQLTKEEKEKVDEWNKTSINPNIRPYKYETYGVNSPVGRIDKWFGQDEVTKERKTVSYGQPNPFYKKPQQQVIVKDQNAPQYKTIHTGEGEGRFEPIQRPKLQAIQNNLQLQGVVSPNIELNTDMSGLRPEARMPKSYNVNSQRQNMSGSSDYYDYNQEGVDFETALRAAEAAEAYNQSIQTRYGNSKNPKAQERLKQLRQDLEVIPNYKNGGWLNSYNNDISQAQNGIEGTMAGLTDRGFNSNGAWGGQFQMGGSIPGSVGFTYARTKGIPSEGPYAKKTMPSAQNGQEMRYYQNGLDWQPKTISKDGSVIKDDRGQWDHPGEITEIGSNQITMEGVPYDVLGVSDTGDTKLMKPGKNYKFKGKKVTEFPMAKNGLRQEQKGLQNLDNLINFTNYNTKQPGGWLDTL
jgi:hypothetical protein